MPYGLFFFHMEVMTSTSKIKNVDSKYAYVAVDASVRYGKSRGHARRGKKIRPRPCPRATVRVGLSPVGAQDPRSLGWSIVTVLVQRVHLEI